MTYEFHGHCRLPHWPCAFSKVDLHDMGREGQSVGRPAQLEGSTLIINSLVHGLLGLPNGLTF
jgi:hypothetical protein